MRRHVLTRLLVTVCSPQPPLDSGSHHRNPRLSNSPTPRDRRARMLRTKTKRGVRVDLARAFPGLPLRWPWPTLVCIAQRAACELQVRHFSFPGVAAKCPSAGLAGLPPRAHWTTPSEGKGRPLDWGWMTAHATAINPPSTAQGPHSWPERAVTRWYSGVRPGAGLPVWCFGPWRCGGRSRSRLGGKGRQGEIWGDATRLQDGPWPSSSR